MVKPIGGRGYKAPYETTHVRVPVDIKAEVEALIDEYRNKLLTPSTYDLPTPSENKPLTSLEQSIERAQEILARKQSARKFMALLLSSIYGIDVNL
jgi:hypothetical protein